MSLSYEAFMEFSERNKWDQAWQAYDELAKENAAEKERVRLATDYANTRDVRLWAQLEVIAKVARARDDYRHPFEDRWIDSGHRLTEALDELCALAPATEPASLNDTSQRAVCGALGQPSNGATPVCTYPPRHAGQHSFAGKGKR